MPEHSHTPLRDGVSAAMTRVVSAALALDRAPAQAKHDEFVSATRDLARHELALKQAGDDGSPITFAEGPRKRPGADAGERAAYVRQYAEAYLDRCRRAHRRAPNASTRRRLDDASRLAVVWAPRARLAAERTAVAALEREQNAVAVECFGPSAHREPSERPGATSDQAYADHVRAGTVTFGDLIERNRRLAQRPPTHGGGGDTDV